MKNVKLTYFDFNGGRGEATRIILSIAKVKFEDHRISFEEFGKIRGSLPLNAVPTVEIDGHMYTQSNSINRYFGKLAGLYPDDAWEAFKCDEIMGATEDVIHMSVRTFGLEGDTLKTARQKLVDSTLVYYLKFLATRLEAAGGKFFADKRFTVADIKTLVQLKSLKAGTLDHVPVDLIDTHAPTLIDYFDRVANEPGVIAYYKSIGAA